MYENNYESITYFILVKSHPNPVHSGPKLELKRNKNTTERFSHAHNSTITFHTTELKYLLKTKHRLTGLSFTVKTFAVPKLLCVAEVKN